MVTISAKLTFDIAHLPSVNERRQVIGNLITKTRQRFNVSVVKISTESKYQMSIGVAVISGEVELAKRSLDEIIRFMEEHANADLLEVKVEHSYIQ